MLIFGCSNSEYSRDSVRSSITWICFMFLVCNVMNLIVAEAGFSETSTTEECACTFKECIRMMQDNISTTEEPPKLKPKCETFGCVKVAAQIISYIDESVDPCEDFYSFANGHYINDTTVETEDDESSSFYSTVTDLVHKKVGPFLSEPSLPNEWKPFRLAKSFFMSCVNQNIIVRRGNQQLIDILNSFGGWPVIEGNSWSSQNFDLNELIKNVKELGFDTDIIFDLNVDTNPINRTTRVLEISTGNYGDGDDDDEFSDKKSLSKYRRKMFDKTVIFADKRDEKIKVRVRKEMDQVLAFQKKLIQISSNDDSEDTEDSDEDGDDESDNDSETDADDDIDTDDADVSDVADQIVTIKQLQESYPYLDWLEYINALLPSGMVVTENEPIMDCDSQFFKKLGDVMKSTSNRTLANYIVWRAIYKAYKMQTFETGKVRRTECIKLTTKKFSIPVGILYSHKYFGEEPRQAVINLVEDVRNAFITMLGEVTWMEDEDREKSIEKAKNIVAHVGYPNDLFQNDELNEYYEDLEIEPDSYFDNSLQWNLFTKNQVFKSLRRPVNRSGWEVLLDLDPITANAFYDPSGNIMQFPIAILHELFFAVNRPQYVNYASLGNTVGHEITHGFDDNGRKYDLIGNQINWWNATTKKNFSEMANCFVDQYYQYTDPKTNLTIDGDNTLDENIADNGGTRAAYYAYLNWVERNGMESLVPGVKYNQKQLFWISYAQAESSVDGKDYLIYQIESDEHATAEFRIKGVVSNSREFANDFNCAEGTKMNPIEKCRMW